MRARRTSAVLAAGASLAVAFAAAHVKPDAALTTPQDIEVHAAPLAGFWKATPPANEHLEWRGGLVLTSPSPQFGGWSGLLMDPEGKRFLALSDSGAWMTGEVTYEGHRPRGLSAARIGALRDQAGEPLRTQNDRDSEAITLASGTLAQGEALVAFERNSRIARVDIGPDGVSPIKALLPIPQDARNVGNNGFEAILRLEAGAHVGAIVAFLEHPLPGENLHRGWIWIGGVPAALRVAGVSDHGITDAVSLPDGSVLMLERRYRPADGVRIRLRRVAADAVVPGGTVEGEVLLEADEGTAEIDNLEALAVTRTTDGETVVTIMSDDNFNLPAQRTLFLQFTLKDAPSTANAAAPARP